MESTRLGGMRLRRGRAFGSGLGFLLLAAATVLSAARAQEARGPGHGDLVRMVPATGLSMEDRIAAQKAVESVYWAHRSWPADNPTPKPILEEAVPEETIREKKPEVLAFRVS